MADNEGDRVLRVLMRFGLDEASAQGVSKAIKGQEDDINSLIRTWETLRKETALTENEKMSLLKGSTAAQKMGAQQVEAVASAYENQQAAVTAAQEAEKQGLEDLTTLQKQMADAEADRLKRIQENTDLIAGSFTNVLALGRAEVSLGRGISSVGRLFGNDDIVRVGQMTTALGRFTSAVGRLPQAFEAVKGAVQSVQAAIATLSTMGAAQLASLGVAVAGVGALAIHAVQTIQTAGTEISAQQAAQRVMQRFETAQGPEKEAIRGQIAGIAEGAADPAQVAQRWIDLDKALSDAAVNAAAGAKGFDEIGKAIWNMTNKVIDQAQKAAERVGEQTTAFDDYQKSIAKSEEQYGDERQKIIDNNLKQINSLTEKFARTNESAWNSYLKSQRNADEKYADQRLKILNSGVDQAQQAETKYYEQRAKAAESYGIEVQRMEEAHQVEMQRLSEDHTKKLRKLADSRDALGIEDEMEAYNTERARKEEDYNRQAAQKSEDFARQMADMEKQFQQEEKVRKDDRVKQLAELAKQKAEDDARRKADYEAAKADRAAQLADEIAQAKKDGDEKLSELQNQHADELNQLNDAWTTRRRQIGLWLNGEQVQFDNYMKARQKDLQTWVDTHLVTPGGTTVSPNVPGGTYMPAPVIPDLTGRTTPLPGGYASGGNVADTGYAMLHAGEFVTNPATTRALERLVGGQLTQSNLLGAVSGGNQVSISVNQSFSGQESSPAVYKQIVYQTITEVFDKAMRQ